MLGPAGELFAQHWVLRRNSDRTGVEVTLPHHDAALHHERRRGESKLLGSEQRGDDHIAAGLELSVYLHARLPTQSVEHQRLLRLGEANLPGNPGSLDRRQR
jgi:hypothetical protein